MNRDLIDGILAKWKHDPDYAIEILQDVQDAYRHLPGDVVMYVADTLAIPVGRLYHIGSFFKAFTFEPRGRHVIQVCMGTACHVKGAGKVLEAFSRELDVPEGKTTADGLFTVEAVRCLGCCALTPIVTIDNELHGEVTPSKVKKIIKAYKGR